MAAEPSIPAKFWSSQTMSCPQDDSLVPGVTDVGNRRPARVRAKGNGKVKGGKTKEVKAAIPVTQPVLVETTDSQGKTTVSNSGIFSSTDISTLGTDISTLQARGVTLKDLCAEDKKRIANLIKELARVGEEKENAEHHLSEERQHYQQQILSLVQQQEAILKEREDVQNRLLEYQSYIVNLQQQQQLQQLLHHQTRNKQQRQQQQQHQQQPKNNDNDKTTNNVHDLRNEAVKKTNQQQQRNYKGLVTQTHKQRTGTGGGGSNGGHHDGSGGGGSNGGHHDGSGGGGHHDGSGGGGNTKTDRQHAPITRGVNYLRKQEVAHPKRPAREDGVGARRDWNENHRQQSFEEEEEEVDRRDFAPMDPSTHLYINHSDTVSIDQSHAALDGLSTHVLPSHTPPPYSRPANNEDGMEEGEREGPTSSRPLPHRPFTAMIDRQLTNERRKVEEVETVVVVVRNKEEKKKKKTNFDDEEAEADRKRAGFSSDCGDLNGRKKNNLNDDVKNNNKIGNRNETRSATGLKTGGPVSPEKAELFSRFMGVLQPPLCDREEDDEGDERNVKNQHLQPFPDDAVAGRVKEEKLTDEANRAVTATGKHGGKSESDHYFHHHQHRDHRRYQHQDHHRHRHCGVGKEPASSTTSSRHVRKSRPHPPPAAYGGFFPPILSSTQKSSEIGDLVSNVDADDSTVVSDRADDKNTGHNHRRRHHRDGVENFNNRMDGGGGGSGCGPKEKSRRKLELDDDAVEGGRGNRHEGARKNGKTSDVGYCEDNGGVRHGGAEFGGERLVVECGLVAGDVDAGDDLLGADKEFLTYYKKLSHSERKQELLNQRSVLLDEQNKLRLLLTRQDTQTHTRGKARVAPPQTLQKVLEDKSKKESVERAADYGRSSSEVKVHTYIGSNEVKGRTYRGEDGDECVTYCEDKEEEVEKEGGGGGGGVDDVVKKLDYSFVSNDEEHQQVPPLSNLDLKFIASPEDEDNNNNKHHHHRHRHHHHQQQQQQQRRPHHENEGVMASTTTTTTAATATATTSTSASNANPLPPPPQQPAAVPGQSRVPDGSVVETTTTGHRANRRQTDVVGRSPAPQKTPTHFTGSPGDKTLAVLQIINSFPHDDDDDDNDNQHLHPTWKRRQKQQQQQQQKEKKKKNDKNKDDVALLLTSPVWNGGQPHTTETEKPRLDSDKKWKFDDGQHRHHRHHHRQYRHPVVDSMKSHVSEEEEEEKEINGQRRMRRQKGKVGLDNHDDEVGFVRRVKKTDRFKSFPISNSKRGSRDESKSVFARGTGVKEGEGVKRMRGVGVLGRGGRISRRRRSGEDSEELEVFDCPDLNLKEARMRGLEKIARGGGSVKDDDDEEEEEEDDADGTYYDYDDDDDSNIDEIVNDLLISSFSSSMSRPMVASGVGNIVDDDEEEEKEDGWNEATRGYVKRLAVHDDDDDDDDDKEMWDGVIKSLNRNSRFSSESEEFCRRNRGNKRRDINERIDTNSDDDEDEEEEDDDESDFGEAEEHNDIPRDVLKFNHEDDDENFVYNDNIDDDDDVNVYSLRSPDSKNARHRAPTSTITATTTRTRAAGPYIGRHGLAENDRPIDPLQDTEETAILEDVFFVSH